MAMQFAIRIEGPYLDYCPDCADSDYPCNCPDIKFEEWDTLKLAEQRATTLRKQGARVEIYKAL